jgi:hypothetical protein
MMDKTNVSIHRRRGLVIFMIVFQLLVVAGVVAYIPLAFFLSGMLTDSGINSTNDLINWVLISAILFSPVPITIFFSAGAWLAFVKGKNKTAVLLTVILLVPFVAFGIIYMSNFI